MSYVGTDPCSCTSAAPRIAGDCLSRSCRPASAPKVTAFRRSQQQRQSPSQRRSGSRGIFYPASSVGSWFATAWVTFSASMAGMTLYTVRFLFPNVAIRSRQAPSRGRRSYLRTEQSRRNKFKEVGALGHPRAPR